jgi:hypothetical protein
VIGFPGRSDIILGPAFFECDLSIEAREKRRREESVLKNKSENGKRKEGGNGPELLTIAGTRQRVH